MAERAQDAVQGKNLHAALRRLVSTEAPPSSLSPRRPRPPMSKTGFAKAVSEGRLVDVCISITRGNDVGHVGYRGRTPLHKATGATGLQDGTMLNMVTLLLSCGAAIDIQDIDGNTPLHMAAKQNARKLINFLLSAGSDPSLLNKHGESPAAMATLPDVKSLLATTDGPPNLPAAASTGMDKDEMHQRLRQAVKCGDVDAVVSALQSGPDLCLVDQLNEDGCSCLHLACVHGFHDVAKQLIEGGATVNILSAEADTPLHYAAYANHVDAVRMLLAHGADPTMRNHESVSSLDLASDPHIRAVLMDAIESHQHAPASASHDSDGVTEETTDNTVDGMSPGATKRASPDETAEAPLKRPRRATLKVKARSSRSNGRRRDAVGVSEGAAARAPDDTSDVAALQRFHGAIRQGDMTTAQEMIRGGTSVHTPDMLGRSALHICAQYNQATIAQVVLASDANVDAIGPRHSTPLHLAAEAGHRDMVLLLLAHGASHEALNGQDQTPAQAASDPSLAAIFPGTSTTTAPIRSPPHASTTRTGSTRSWNESGMIVSSTTEIDGFEFDEYTPRDELLACDFKKYPTKLRETPQGLPSTIDIIASDDKRLHADLPL
eukprot:m.87526 g.87526  ORF g.87526 m.87526 type:complete len:606 (-) comp9704_c2_seq2:2349-4166(-)